MIFARLQGDRIPRHTTLSKFFADQRYRLLCHLTATGRLEEAEALRGRSLEVVDTVENSAEELQRGALMTFAAAYRHLRAAARPDGPILAVPVIALPGGHDIKLPRSLNLELSGERRKIEQQSATVRRDLLQVALAASVDKHGLLYCDSCRRSHPAELIAQEHQGAPAGSFASLVESGVRCTLCGGQIVDLSKMAPAFARHLSWRTAALGKVDEMGQLWRVRRLKEKLAVLDPGREWVVWAAAGWWPTPQAAATPAVAEAVAA